MIGILASMYLLAVEGAIKPPTFEGGLDWFAMAMSAIAGLVLFIYGVTRLAEGLGELNSERMRRWTSRFTSNRLAGVGTGFVATTLLESSSVVIIMVIAMVPFLPAIARALERLIPERGREAAPSSQVVAAE